MCRSLICFLLAQLLFAFSPFSLNAQQHSQASLEGNVNSATGTPLPFVNVYIPSLQRGTATAADGSYQFKNLPAQTLRVRFTHVGFQTKVREVTLTSGQSHTLNVRLTDQAVEREEITVTGTATATDVLTAPQEVDVITPAELRLSRTASLGKLLAELPGVSNIQTGAQAGKPVLRGLSGSRIRFLQDGIAQEYFQYGVRHFPATSLLQTERVEVVRGAASILYGSDALGGAINSRTKSLPAPTDQLVLGGRAAAQYFSNNNEQAGTLELHGSRRQLGFRAGIERRVGDNFTTPNASTFFETGQNRAPKYTGEVPFTNFEQLSAYLKGGYRGSFGNVEAMYDHWQNNHNFLLPIGGPSKHPTNPPVGLGQHLSHDNLHVKGNLINSGLVLKPTVSFQRSVRRSAKAGIRFEEDPSWPLDLQKDLYTTRLELLHPEFFGLEGTIGLDLQHQTTVRQGSVELEPSSTVNNLAAFAFEELALNRLTLSVGARLDHRWQQAQPNERTTDPALLQNTYTVTSGSFGANYRIAQGLALASNLGLGFRAPSVFELYANGVHGGVAAFQQGNPHLTPERSKSLDLSLRLHCSRLKGRITAHNNWIHNYIYLKNTAQTNGDLPLYRSAQTDAVIQGIDTGLRFELLPWVQLGGQLAVIHSSGQGLNASRKGPLPLLPANRLEGFIRLTRSKMHLLHDLHLKLHVKHVLQKDAAGRYEPFAQFDFGPAFGTASTDAYTLLNLEAGASVQLGGLPMALHLTAQNLLNTGYRDFLDTYKGYTLSVGRNIGFKLSVPFALVK